MKNPSGLCQCGCGRKSPLSTASRRGYKRGEPLLYIKGHSSRAVGSDYEERDCGYATPCWVWAKSMCSTGYGRVWNGHGHDMAHRVYYERHVGLIPEGLEIDHLCRNRRCVNPDHLEPVTHAENGRRGKNTKLSRKDVEAIRNVWTGSDGVAFASTWYGIHESHVRNIQNGKQWIAA